MSENTYGSRESHSRSRSRSSSRSSSGSRSGSRSRSPSPSPGHGGRGVEDPKVLFCSIHEVDLKPDTCNACLHVSHMIKPNVLKELRKEGRKVNMGDFPSAAARFCHSDEKPPTLILSDSSMELATKIFSLGRFKVPHHFEDLTKEHLFLPAGQNDVLTANLTMENMFRHYERGGKHKHVFTFKNQVIKVTRDLRVAQVLPTWPNVRISYYFFAEAPADSGCRAGQDPGRDKDYC